MSDAKKVTRSIYDDAKDGQRNGENSATIGKNLSLTLVQVNDILSSRDWSDYSGEEQEIIDVPEIMEPARVGYYRGLVAKKAEENDSLKEQRGWLLEQVYFLRKAVRFLEAHKADLETGIRNMEKQILGGISAIEQLESNKEFTELSDKIVRKN